MPALVDWMRVTDWAEAGINDPVAAMKATQRHVCIRIYLSRE
jgi:hypothetical protein